MLGMLPPAVLLQVCSLKQFPMYAKRPELWSHICRLPRRLLTSTKSDNSCPITLSAEFWVGNAQRPIRLQLIPLFPGWQDSPGAQLGLNSEYLRLDHISKYFRCKVLLYMLPGCPTFGCCFIWMSSDLHIAAQSHHAQLQDLYQVQGNEHFTYMKHH